MTKRPYPIRKGTMRDLGFSKWFVATKGLEAYSVFVGNLDTSPTEQAYVFKTTTTTIHKWRKAYKEELS